MSDDVIVGDVVIHEYYPRDTSSRRRALKVGADVREVTDKDWERLCAQYHNECAYCGRKLKLTQDHVMPLDRGGRHSIGNLVPACKRCNTKKANKTLVEWKKEELKNRRRARMVLMNFWPEPDLTEWHIVKCQDTKKYALARWNDMEDVDEHFSHYSNVSDARADWARFIERGF
jgi:hypothetical protein